jgi:hypothetical protein
MSRQTSLAPAFDDNSYTAKLVSLLHIPASLTVRPKAVDIRLAYSKYEAYHKAQRDLYRMIENGSWNVKQPTTDQLVEIFVSKSVWHGYYSKVFPEVHRYPLLHKWLLKASDAPPNVEIFEKEKHLYTFKDLMDVLERLDSKKHGKRKAKGSVDEGQRKKKKGKREKRRASVSSVSE